MSLVASLPLFLLSCSPAAACSIAAPAADVAPLEAVASPCTVTSTNDTGPGTLRAVAADTACPVVTFDIGGSPIYIYNPITVDRSVELRGEPTSQAVPGTVGVSVGTAAIPIDPVYWPSVEIVNRGYGDGLRVTAGHVAIENVAVRGTDISGSADITAWNIDDLTLNGVVLGIDRAGGLDRPPVWDRTGNVPVFQASGSTNVRLERSAFGWNGPTWGAVGFWATTNSHVYRSFVAGAGGDSVGPNTLDAISIVFGSDRIGVRDTYVENTRSSSAVELHSATRVTIDDSTFTGSGRAGVTVFDAHDVTVAGVVIADTGTCGTPVADMGGVAVYPNSDRVTVTGSDISTLCNLPTVAVL